MFFLMPEWVKEFLHEGSTKLTVEAVYLSFNRTFNLTYVSPPKYQFDGGYFVDNNGFKYTTTSMDTAKHYIKITLNEELIKYVEIDSLSWSDLCTVMNHYIDGCPKNNVFPDNVRFHTF